MKSLDSNNYELLKTRYFRFTNNEKGEFLREGICSFIRKREIGFHDMYYFNNLGNFHSEIEVSVLWIQKEKGWNFRPVYIEDLKYDFLRMKEELRLSLPGVSENVTELRSSNRIIEADFFQGVFARLKDRIDDLEGHLDWINSLKIGNSDLVPILRSC